MKIVERLKIDGSLEDLKWMLVFMLLFGFLGAIFGAGKVFFLEQDKKGLYAIHNECVDWDEICVRNCEDADPVGNSGKMPDCSGCCEHIRPVKHSLGMRMKAEGKLWGIWSMFSLGWIVGLIVSTEKKRST